MDDLAKIELHVHKKDLGCATWISKQVPSKVAEALSICESACSALHCQLSSGEIQQHAKEIRALQNQQLQRENDIKSHFEAIVANKDNELTKASLKHKDECVALQQQLKELEESYKATQTALFKEIKILQTTVRQAEGAKTQLLQDMQSQVSDEVDSARVHLEKKYAADMSDALAKVKLEKEHETRQCHNEIDSIKRQFETDISISTKSYESKLNIAASEIENLKSQLLLQQNAIGDVKETFRQQAEVERVANQQRIDVLTENHASRVEELRGFVKSYESQLAEAHAHVHKANEEKERRILHCNDQLQSIKKEQQEQMQKINDEQRDFLSTLSGSQVKGKIGERYVDEVVGELDVGVLTDVSRKQREGFADRFWQYDFHSSQIPGVRGLVEVKYSNELHKTHDLEKFNNDVKSGVEQNRINCAIMLSLTARIQGSKQIGLEFVDGIPVLRASRSAADSLSPMNLVKMAFLTLIEVWPYLASNKSRNEDLIIDTVSSFLDSQLDRIEKLQPQIDFLEKTAGQMQREASALRKCKDEMSHDVASLKMQHPQLITNACHQKNDKIHAMNALIDAIEAFKSRKKRVAYPKQLEDLQLTTDVSKHATAQMFDDAVTIVRKKTKPGKRKREVDPIPQGNQ